MKNLNIIAALVLLLIALSFGSCSVVGGIFKAGMGVGVFIVVVVIIIVLVVLSKIGKK